MYQDYFGLNCKPFGIVPDTRFLFLSDSHREAIAHLVYALNEKNGFVQLTGEVGVGKTMACRYILANTPEDIDVALILNPRVNEIGLLRMLCDELHIVHSKDLQPNELTRLIYDKLMETYAANRHTILIIDEAQNLPKRTLEQLRLLTNLETDTQKLLRIILIGQPELGELLAEYDMRQVAQRITSRYHLTTLGPDETDDYIHHRLKVAGCHHRLFTKSACRKAHKLTQGTPRLLNLLCDRALIGAYSRGEHEVNSALIRQAAKEALPFVKSPGNKSNGNRLLSTLLILILLLGALLIALPGWRDQVLQYWQTPQASQPVTPAKQPADNTVTPLASANIQTDTASANQIPENQTPANQTKTGQPGKKAITEGTQFDNRDLRDVALTDVALTDVALTDAALTDVVRPAGPHPDGISPAQLEEMKKQADVDFRMGIPATVDTQD